MRQEPEYTGQYICNRQDNEHCLTCGDIAVRVQVVRVDGASQTALVELEHGVAEVDISLVEAVVPGDRLLVHGGVAISVEPAG